MKRDLSLCRELLLKLEGVSDSATAAYHFPFGDDEVALEGWSADEITYNFARMLEAGFFAENSETTAEGGFIFTGISWAGHDYLDAVRDPERWRKTKDGAKAVGGLTFGLAKDLALAIAKSEVSSKLGIHM